MPMREEDLRWIDRILHPIDYAISKEIDAAESALTVYAKYQNKIALYRKNTTRQGIIGEQAKLLVKELAAKKLIAESIWESQVEKIEDLEYLERKGKARVPAPKVKYYFLPALFALFIALSTIVMTLAFGADPLYLAVQGFFFFVNSGLLVLLYLRSNRIFWTR